MFTGLGQQGSYVSTGYNLDVVWQPSYDSQWELLGCLSSLVSLKLNGSLPVLPAAWAENSSFPLLQVRHCFFFLLFIFFSCFFFLSFFFFFMIVVTILRPLTPALSSHVYVLSQTSAGAECVPKQPAEMHCSQERCSHTLSSHSLSEF